MHGQQRHLVDFFHRLIMCNLMVYFRILNYLAWFSESVLLLHLTFLILQVTAISKEWADRADLPPHVVNMLNNFPSNLHPMAQFSAAITALNSESKFAKGYSDGVHKTKYWEVRQVTKSQKCEQTCLTLHSYYRDQTCGISSC